MCVYQVPGFPLYGTPPSGKTDPDKSFPPEKGPNKLVPYFHIGKSTPVYNFRLDDKTPISNYPCSAFNINSSKQKYL